MPKRFSEPIACPLALVVPSSSINENTLRTVASRYLTPKRSRPMRLR